LTNLSFPGIPDDALEAIVPANPVDMGLLRDQIAEFADPPDGPLARMEEYGAYLLAGNTVARLMGPRDWDALFPHILDCAAAASFVPQDARTILDWGSGGGLPGLVWAILFPEKRILLAERNGKKAGFLEEAAVRLELTNVEVLHGQAEEELKHEERPDIMVARAVEPLPKLLKRIRRNRVRFGSLFLMAGPSWEQDWEELPEATKSSWVLPARHRYSLGERGNRYLAVFKPR
jgi:16S rRNA (guanine527-N7)-methyltransferase